jgi:hypothetical protein
VVHQNHEIEKFVRLRIVEFCRDETGVESIRILLLASSCMDEAEEVWKNFLLLNLGREEA